MIYRSVYKNIQAEQNKSHFPPPDTLAHHHLTLSVEEKEMKAWEEGWTKSSTLLWAWQHQSVRLIFASMTGKIVGVT